MLHLNYREKLLLLQRLLDQYLRTIVVVLGILPLFFLGESSFNTNKLLISILKQSNTNLNYLPCFGDDFTSFYTSIHQMKLTHTSLDLQYLIMELGEEDIDWDALEPDRSAFLGWKLGCRAFAQQKYITAINIWKEHSPQATNILAHLSVAAFDSGDKNLAEELAYLAEEIDKTPSREKVKLYNRFCLFAMSENKSSEALSWCSKLNAVSDSWTSKTLMGIAYLNNNRYLDAQELFTDLLKNDPNWVQGYTYLAKAYAGSGEWSEVVRLLEDASKQINLEEKASLLLAEAWLRTQRIAPAKDLLLIIKETTQNATTQQEACGLANHFQIDIGCTSEH